jgi:hypothetical protein
MIDSGMKRGIPIEKHDNVVTFYGDYSSYQEALGMGDINLAYVFFCWTKRKLCDGVGMDIQILRSRKNL